MATFTNQASLTYNGLTATSNIVTGELLETLSITKEALNMQYNADGSLTYAVYWSAETVAVPDDEEEQALYRMIYVEKPDIMAGSAHKTGFNASVRCVRNVTE